jgi:N-methylhydantoinase A
MAVTLDELSQGGLATLTRRFDAEHNRLFTFNMDAEHELVNLRATALGAAVDLPAHRLPEGDGDPAQAKLRDHTLWMDGAQQAAVIYDRSRLEAGDMIPGPAIIIEMDSTTLIETRHMGVVDAHGNILINPV